jgi:hypothetical protein
LPMGRLPFAASAGQRSHWIFSLSYPVMSNRAGMW